MSDNIFLVGTIIAVADIFVFLYATYWSLAIRNVLSVKLYRRRALWVGAIGTYFVAYFLFVASAWALGVTSFSDNILLRFAAGVFAYTGAVAFFVWIDSTVRVARRSDPLRRDTLHWSKLRWFLGFFIFIGTFFALVFNVTSSTFVRATPLYGPIGLVLLLGGISLFRSASRSGDPTLRRHLKWFGLFAVLAWATTIVESETFSRMVIFDQDLLPIVSYVLFAVSAYSLYKSARSLVPFAPMPLPSDKLKDPVAPAQSSS